MIRLRPDAPVVVLLSTYDECEFDHQGSGAAAYVPKGSFGPDRLVAGVGRRDARPRASPPPARAGAPGRRRSCCVPGHAHRTAGGLDPVDHRLVLGPVRAEPAQVEDQVAAVEGDVDDRRRSRAPSAAPGAAEVRRRLHPGREPPVGGGVVHVQRRPVPGPAKCEAQRRADAGPGEGGREDPPGQGRAAGRALPSSGPPARRAPPRRPPGRSRPAAGPAPAAAPRGGAARRGRWWPPPGGARRSRPRTAAGGTPPAPRSGRPARRRARRARPRAGRCGTPAPPARRGPPAAGARAGAAAGPARARPTRVPRVPDGSATSTSLCSPAGSPAPPRAPAARGPGGLHRGGPGELQPGGGRARGHGPADRVGHRGQQRRRVRGCSRAVD